MSLFSLLSWSSTSLQAQRAQSETASHNLSNANTPGYARQRATLAANLPADHLGANYLGQGVSLLAITQARDGFVEQQLPSALSSAARSGAQASSLESISALDPDGANSLTSALGAFYSSLRQLAQTPGDLGSRNAVVAASQSLALAFNRASQGLSQARAGVDTQLAAGATHATDLARSLADLNRQVRVESASGGVPNDLLDARQRVQDELVALTGAVVVPDSDGNVNLQLPGGGALVSGDTAMTLSTQPDPANGGHLLVRATAPGGVPTTLAPTALGGTMRGLLDARDGALATAERSLDTMAFDWADSVNTQHRAGFGLDGVSGRDLFSTSATSTGAARALVVAAGVLADPRQLAASATAAGVPGDATNLFSVIQTENAALTNGLNVFDGLAAAIAGYGGSVQAARTAADSDAAVKDQLSSLRESASGVSIDEEMVQLTQSQRGYEAVMKVIKTTDEMLQSLLDLRP